MTRNLTIRQKGLLLVSVPMLFQLAFCGILLWQHRSAEQADYWHTHTKEVLMQTQIVSKSLLKCESGIRGFAVSGDPSFAASFEQTARELPLALGQLQDLLSHNPSQTALANVIKDQAERFLAWHAENQRMLNGGEQEQVVNRIKSGVGKRAMDSLNEKMAIFVQEENRLDAERTLARDHLNRRFTWIIMAAMGLCVLISVALSLSFSRGISSRLRTVADNSYLYAEGKEVALPVSGSDEIAQLDRTFQNVATKLNVANDKLRANAAELAKETTLLQSIVNSIGEGLVAADQDGRFTLFNPGAEKLIGKASDVDREKWSEQYHLYLPDMRTPYPPEQLPLARALRGESVDDVEICIRRNGDSTQSWINCAARPLRDAMGRPQGGLVVFRDETDRRRMVEELRQAKDAAEVANLAKSEFLSRTSHELRTPLNSILGFGQMLAMSPLGSRDKRRVDQIVKGGRHLLHLIDEVLDIARIEAGRMQLSLEPIRVQSVVDESVDLIRPQAEQQGIHLQIDPAPDGWFVLADNQRLKQVLLNLLSNAIKYNQARGSVVVSCQEWAVDRLRLVVRDTGPGIPPEKLGRLFEPFNRLGAENTTIEGTGLGLALSRGLIELMGGSVTVASEVGRGTVVAVELPRTGSPHQKSKVPEQQSLGPASGPERVLLYIEDNLANLNLVEDILEDQPAVRLLTAMQGSLGLDMARQHHPDLILLDVHLPDIHGDEFMRRLNQDPALQGIPVVVLSADATAGQIELLRSLGVQDYLTKPLDVVRFLEVLTRIFGEKQGDLDD